MASINQREAGREFEGNGASSFDAREYRVSPQDVAAPSAGAEAAYQAALVQIERAFGPAALARQFGGSRKEAA